MSAQSDYIAYLETKVCDIDFQRRELEATLMLIMFAETNKINRELLYLHASKVLYGCMPYSDETVKHYKDLLSDLQG